MYGTWTAQLPALQIIDTGEALLGGRQPPFCLLVRVVDEAGEKINIRPVLSENFVVSLSAAQSKSGMVRQRVLEGSHVPFH